MNDRLACLSLNRAERRPGVCGPFKKSISKPENPVYITDEWIFSGATFGSLVMDFETVFVTLWLPWPFPCTRHEALTCCAVLTRGTRLQHRCLVPVEAITSQQHLLPGVVECCICFKQTEKVLLKKVL